jgi:hypothetical protein
MLGIGGGGGGEDARSQFDTVALGIITHLESLSDVCSVNFACPGSVSSHGE